MKTIANYILIALVALMSGIGAAFPFDGQVDDAGIFETILYGGSSEHCPAFTLVKVRPTLFFTAGHCLYKDGRYAKEVRIVPLSARAVPRPTIFASAWRVPQEYEELSQLADPVNARWNQMGEVDKYSPITRAMLAEAGARDIGVVLTSNPVGKNHLATALDERLQQKLSAAAGVPQLSEEIAAFLRKYADATAVGAGYGSHDCGYYPLLMTSYACVIDFHRRWAPIVLQESHMVTGRSDANVVLFRYLAQTPNAKGSNRASGPGDSGGFIGLRTKAGKLILFAIHGGKFYDGSRAASLVYNRDFLEGFFLVARGK